MAAVLDILKDRKDLLTNEVYLLSAVTALQHLIETLLHFISPYLQDTIAQVCHTGTASSSHYSVIKYLLFTQLCSMLICCNATVELVPKIINFQII